MNNFRFKKKIKNILGFIVALTLLSFLVVRLYNDWDKLSTYNWSFNYYYLFIAFFILLFLQILLSYSWWLILKKINERLDFKKSLYIWSISQIGRYIPGKVWFIFGRVYLCSKEGVSKAKSFISIVLEIGLNVTSGLLIALVSLFLFIDISLVKKYLPLFMIIPVGLFFLQPSILEKSMNIILKILKKPTIKLGMRYKDILLLLLIYMFLWFVFGTAFYFLVRSVYSGGIDNFFILLGIFAIAWVAGFLFFITPAGLGVREGVLVFLLNYHFPLAICIIISLLSRIVMTIAELIVVLIVWNFRPEKKILGYDDEPKQNIYK